MRNLRLVLLPVIAVCLVVAHDSGAVHMNAAAPANLQNTSAESMVSDGTNGMPILNEMMRQAQDMGAYKYDGTVDSVKGNNIVEATGTFFYKPTNQIRVEVKNFGAKSGSTLIKRKDGKVIAKGGAAMLGVKLTLPPDSRLLVMPNGISAVDCDIVSLTGIVKRQLASGGKLVSCASPMKLGNFSTPVIVLETLVPKDATTKVAARIFVDATRKLPIQWDFFDNGKIVSRALFNGYQSGLQIDDSKFDM